MELGRWIKETSEIQKGNKRLGDRNLLEML